MVNQLHDYFMRYFKHYRMDRIPNYEEIAYLASQGCDQSLGELDNPIVLTFSDNLRREMSDEINELRNHDFNSCIDHNGDEDMLASLLEESRNYIADVVWRCLLRTPESLSHLCLFKQLCNNLPVTSISTLCHDIHLEGFLRNEDFAINDGFSDVSQAGIRYWDGDFSSIQRTPFLKLHGSIDWFELYVSDGSFYDNQVGLVSQKLDCQRLKNENDDWLHSTGRPMLLIGTFNKISQYSAGIFRDLHCCFRSTLNNASQLIVCGYSFNDKGINSEIIGWIYGNRERKLIVIHPDPDSLLSNARPAIRNRWCEWEENGSIEIVEKLLEDVDFTDLPLRD